MYESISKLLTDESVISFTDGAVVKGPVEVTDFVIKCCMDYNKGYIGAVKRYFGYGIIIGVVGYGTHMGIKKIIKSKKLKAAKLESKGEEA